MEEALETIGLLTFLQKALACWTGFRIHEVALCPNSDNQEGGSAYLGGISHLADNIHLRMDGTAISEAILPNGDHLATKKEDRHMVTCSVLRCVAALLAQDNIANMLVDPERERHICHLLS